MSATIIILGTVLVVLIIYLLFQSYFDGEQKLVTQTLLINAVDPDTIASPNASNFSYGIWIYIKQWKSPDGTEPKTRIFTRGDEIGLYLTKDASLKVRFADIGVKSVKTRTKDVGYSEIILTNNFPIQKWVHVGLVVDGNKFDGYIDGKMVKSIQLNGNITPGTDDKKGTASHKLEFGKENAMNETLMIAEHKRRTYAMDPKGMWDLYMNGNGANGLTKVVGDLNVNLSIVKDGVVSSKYSVW